MATQEAAQSVPEAFTPGPWRVLDHLTAGPTIVVSRDQRHVADTDFEWWSAGQCAANARLIAAAPQLYEALGRLMGCSELNDENREAMADAAAVRREVRGDAPKAKPVTNQQEG